MITVEQYKKLVPASKAHLLVYLNNVLKDFAIDTYLRKCHFLAQTLHESGSFHYMEEIASGAAYEGRKDLGNIKKGDGIKFKGRGIIQITGRANYALLSKDLGIDFVSNPTWLCKNEYAFLSAGWFWNKHKLSLLADKDDLDGISDLINRGHHTIRIGDANGYSNRELLLNKCKKVLA